MEPRISLEKLNVSHAQELYDLTISNRAYLKVWLPWLDHIESVEDTKSFITSSLKESSSGSALHYAIVNADEIFGVVSFNEINRMHRIGSIGYWLDENSTGKGIISSAVRRLLDIGFNELNLNKIEIRCAEENIKSRSVAERLGFTYEATLRQCEWLYTKYVNHAIYSMLANEYKNIA